MEKQIIKNLNALIEQKKKSVALGTLIPSIGMLTNANLVKEIATLEAARVILLNAVVPVRCHECEKVCTKQCWFFRQDEHTGTMVGPDDNFFCADGKRRKPQAPGASFDIIPY